jgi:hypothetical protein
MIEVFSFGGSQPATTATVNTTVSTAEKAPCACEEHKRKMREKAMCIADDQMQVSRVQKAISFLLFLILVLAVISFSKRVFA